MIPRIYSIYTDGASRGNPGPSGGVIFGPENEIVAEISEYLGIIAIKKVVTANAYAV